MRLHVSQLELGIQDYRLPWVFAKHKTGLVLGTSWRRLIWPHHVFRIIRLLVLWSSNHLFCLLALSSVIRVLAIAAVPWMLDLWSSRRAVCVETRSSRWVLSSTVTFTAVVLWFLDTIPFEVRRSPSLSLGCRPLFLSADDVYSWYVYAVTTLDTCISGYT